MSSFYTQGNLVIEQASTEALIELKKMLGEGFQNNAEITEILFEDEPHPQINMIIYEKMDGASMTQFDKELLYMMEELLKIDLEVILNFKHWDGDILDKEDEFYLDEITDLQEQFLEARIEFFKDLAKKKIDANKMAEDFEKVKSAIDIIRANPLACPETDIYWKNSENPKLNGYSGTDYGDAEEWQVEGIFDEVAEVAMSMNEYDSLPIGKGSLITLIDQELIAKPDDKAIMIGFFSYKLTLPSNINLVVVLFFEGEMDKGKFESDAYEKYNIINPKTLDRGISPSLFTELKSEFTKYFS